MTDKEIIAGFRKDEDERWVGMLYERYAHLVLGLCCKYLKDKCAAEDATCEIFMSLFQKLKKHEVTHFKSWLYTTSRNHCLMQLRAAKNGKMIALNGHELIAEDGMSIVQLKENRLDLLESKIDELNEEQRDCVRYFYLEEQSYAQVADKLNMSLNSVKSHIQNGKRNLRILLLQHKEFNES